MFFLLVSYICWSLSFPIRTNRTSIKILDNFSLLSIKHLLLELLDDLKRDEGEKKKMKIEKSLASLFFVTYGKDHPKFSSYFLFDTLMLLILNDKLSDMYIGPYHILHKVSNVY